MNSEARDYLKIALLGVIAVSLTYGTFFKKSSKSRRSIKSTAAVSSPRPQTPGPNAQNGDISVGIEPGTKEGTGSNYLATSVEWVGGDSHNFGTIKQHTENTHVFKFKNTGTEPLVIQDAQGSCGCTVPEYPKEPIFPGNEGEIIVKYSPGTQIGSQTKTVVITSNSEPKAKNLYITANVEEAPDPLLGE